MSLTYEEIKEKLSRYDEVTILEVLEINTYDILDKFEDRILDNLDVLADELESADEH